MPQKVIDVASNLEENIKRWAEALRRNGKKRRLFELIYSTKRRRWTTAAVAESLGVSKQAAAALCGALRGDTLLNQVAGTYPHEYEKIPDAQHYKRRIVAAARNKANRDAIPTKRNVKISIEHRAAKASRFRAKYLPTERIDQFAKMDKADSSPMHPIPESKFKAGLKRIFKEDRKFGDWGGERNDFYTDKLKIGGRRYPAAFALKGPGVRLKKMVPGKWGIHGNQIQRLVSSPAQVLMLQFEGEIDEYSREQLKRLAQLKAIQEDEPIYYGFIDDSDSARLRRAFRNCFR